jgi:hypothetical protein
MTDEHTGPDRRDPANDSLREAHALFGQAITPACECSKHR